MFEKLFGLTENPFNLTPDPKYLYLSGIHKEAIAHLRYGINERKGFVLLTGEVGAGKSTSLRWAAGQLHPSRYKTLWITATSGSILEVYRQLLAELDINTVASSRAVLTRLIRQQIHANP